MKIIAAPDSFKGSLGAPEVAEAMARGIRRVYSDTEVIKLPMADGGEGTVQALVSATEGSLHRATVRGPLGDPVEAVFGVLGDGYTAVIEMASASGLPLVPESRRNPLVTTTYGTGELIVAALDRECRRFIIGIGGSATNDGGAGMAQALGARLLGDEGKDLGPGGGELARLAVIETAGMDSRLRECTFTVACDVNNPLCGPKGASAVYGPQKGATPDMVAQLDSALEHYAGVIKEQLGKDMRDVPGAGAAGGLGGGLIAFLGAELKPGVTLVMEAIGLGAQLEGSSLVITGEGKLDRQTMYGKVPWGVARLARSKGVPVLALAGSIGPGTEALYDMGIDAMMAIMPGPMTLEEAMAQASLLIEEATERALRLIRVGEGLKDVPRGG